MNNNKLISIYPFKIRQDFNYVVGSKYDTDYNIYQIDIGTLGSTMEGYLVIKLD